MRRIFSAAFIVGVVGLAAGLLADSWVAPQPRVFSSWAGARAVKVIPPKGATGGTGRATATLYWLAGDGTENVLWSRELVNIPMTAIVEEQGKYVVTFDTYAHLGYEHALVIYDAKGAVISDHKLEDLLTKEEIETKVLQTVSSRRWIDSREAVALRLDGDSPLVIPLAWGRKISIDMPTGKVTSIAAATQPQP